jgi:1-acyl-sn-glycerol-3-phosphate acyltransferase
MVVSKSALRAQAERLARRIGARLYGGYTWIVFAVLLLAFGCLAPFTGSVEHARRLARFIARGMFGFSGIPISAVGLERLPAPPHLLLVNHASFLDGILLTALLPATPGYAFVTRQQYTLQSLLWPFLRSLRILVLKHHESSHHTENVDILKSALQRGGNLVVFPEGGFAAEPGLKRFHSGAFVAAAQAQVPIVVVGLRGTRNALRVGTWMPKRLALAIEIGPVLTPRGTDSEAMHALMQAARAAMLPLTGESSGVA